ncbi:MULTISPECIES: bifunctional SulP family inorganic anion transporter/carbonic anhydrase [unclassified Amycolatopsis]|uniref:bifunctional SulP family inorganic anion transporter/carbonic anhydrase n=1 Tax=unclassified Amycolatopsis TaxID=2618356 RepID=UPI002E20C1BA|nr:MULTISPECIES: bifunctional SulP family inorganic anion transporter/carbonic anhydrase [unclassified Amycolatopsis]
MVIMRPLAVLRHDLPASLVVFLVAVPLSLGIALASGAPVAAGLIAAVVGGVVAGALGGSALQVSGPAAGLTVIMAETISTFGWAVTCLITVAAGALQILLGLSRIARAALAISPAIVHGMLAGIGVTIVLGQLHVILGGKAQSSAVENVAELPGQIVAHHDSATVIGLLTIAILLIWPRLPKAVQRVPGPLAAIAFATVASVATGMTLPRVELPGDLLNVHLVPQLPDGGWGGFALAVVTIALIASVESLLSAVAVDRMHTGPRANLDRELVGQGAANMVSGALGGLPVTGVIVRSSTNVAAGAKTRVSAILHGVWVLVFVVLLAGLIQNIPLAALAGLLVHVGAKLVNPGHMKTALRHGDLPVYLLTLAGVVVFDLLTGVLAGIGLALVLMLRRTVWSGIHVERENTESDGDRHRVVVEGVLTFLSVPRLSKVLGAIPAGVPVRLELVVDYLDHAAFESLTTWQQAHERAGGTVDVDEVGHPWFGEGKAGRPTRSRFAASQAVPRWLAPWSDWQAAEAVDIPAQQTRRGATEFHRRAAPLLRDTLSGLADGQKPRTLFITCGDSRIVPNLITTSGPGDLFTIRNIGNLVPPGQADPSMNASIEYAVGVLGVEEIVVCGHSGCGAMAALADGPPPGPLETWLRYAVPSARRSGPVTVDGARPAREGDRLALLNVLQQLDHLREYPQVAAAEAAGKLQLTGMYFDVGAAQVHLLDGDARSFRLAGAAVVPEG